MKSVFSIALLLISGAVFGQGNTTYQSAVNTSIIYNGGLGAVKRLSIPSYSDTAEANVYYSTYPNFSKANNIIWTYSPPSFWVNNGSYWSRLPDYVTVQSLISAAVDTTSLSNRINLKQDVANITDDYTGGSNERYMSQRGVRDGLATKQNTSDTSTWDATRYDIDTALATPANEVVYGTGSSITSEPAFNYNPSTNTLTADTIRFSRFTIADTPNLVTYFVGIPKNAGTEYPGYGLQERFRSSWAVFPNANPNSGRPNVVWNLASYNVAPGGGRINPREAAFRMGLECHFEQAGTQLFEYHLLETIDTNNNYLRPFSIYANKTNVLNSFIQSNVRAFELFAGAGPSGRYFSAEANATNGQWVTSMNSPNGSSGLRISGNGTNNIVFLASGNTGSTSSIRMSDFSEIRLTSVNTFSIGATAPNGVVFYIDNTSKGSIPFPRMSTTARNSLGTLTDGLQVYDSTVHLQSTYDGTRWVYTPKILLGSATLDFPSTSANSYADLTISVTGAAVGDPVVVGSPSFPNNVIFSAQVTASNTVTVRLINNSSTDPVDPSPGTFTVKVFK